MDNLDIANLLLAVLPVLLAITVHEAAHGYMARYYGDHTAEMMGRLSFNPIRHIDPVGTILVPLIIFFSSKTLTGMPMIFGWAKPVPVIPRNFRNRRIGERMVSIAGPLSNLLMCFGWLGLLFISPWVPDSFIDPLSLMCWYGISFNISLFVLNMIPILPLDGGHFVNTFLPAHLSQQYQKTEPYGMWVLMFLLISGLLNDIIAPFYSLLMMLVKFIIKLFY